MERSFRNVPYSGSRFAMIRDIGKPNKSLNESHQISSNDSIQAPKISENKGVDQVQIVCHGLKVIAINDLDNNFLPIMSCNFSNFKITWDHNAKQSCIWTDLTGSLNYFNVTVGVWEPFVEKFGFKLMVNQEILLKK